MRAAGLALAISMTLAIGVTAYSIGVARAQAQGSAAPLMKTFTSSSDVAAMIAQAKSERKENQPIVTKPILALAPYRASLEYRASVGPAAVHETEAEMFYVIDGSGTLMTGGKLVKESRTNAENLTGTGIEGGESRAVAKGDFFIVPQNTPHWFSSINGSALVLMSLHVPRVTGGAGH
jgi:mannose-6-phosphate isomerase-like protein (cupin superfamily)